MDALKMRWDYADANAKSFNKKDLDNMFDSIFRDFGMVNGKIYKHSKKCIYMKDDKGITRWCCSDDCRI
jgi:hypothetical protein